MDSSLNSLLTYFPAVDTFHPRIDAGMTQGIHRADVAAYVNSLTRRQVGHQSACPWVPDVAAVNATRGVLAKRVARVLGRLDRDEGRLVWNSEQSEREKVHFAFKSPAWAFYFL